MPRVLVNGTEIHHEIRGTGVPLLLIMGGSGDGGHFDVFADLLSDEFAVITYDRRGNGRSPVPAGWTTTSPEEQADDAAGLLDALGLSPAAVFGTSSGAVFALCLLARHPAAVCGAVLHEPALFGLLGDLDAVRAPLRARIQPAMETGGPAAATEPWWRYVAGDDGWDRLAPALRERMRASANTTFGIELGTYERYLPYGLALQALAPRVRLLDSADGLPACIHAACRLGQRLGRDVKTTAGTHVAYHDHPSELAQAVRPLLRELTAMST
jgi:pimeloyl-ACP methyl ester carboxylesterase